MDASSIGAFASLVTALIIAITAIAAFVQIRHVRNSNEIAVYLRMIERLDSFGAAGAFDRVRSFVDRLAREPQLRCDLAKPTMVEDAREITGVVLFVEHLSTLVVTRGVTERLVLAEYAEDLVELWDHLAEFVYLRRIGRGASYAIAFEDVAMRARRFVDEGRMERIYGKLRKDPRMAAFAPPNAAP